MQLTSSIKGCDASSNKRVEVLWYGQRQGTIILSYNSKHHRSLQD